MPKRRDLFDSTRSNRQARTKVVSTIASRTVPDKPATITCHPVTYLRCCSCGENDLPSPKEKRMWYSQKSRTRCTYKYNHGELLNTGSRTCIFATRIRTQKTRQCTALAICTRTSHAVAINIKYLSRIIVGSLSHPDCAPVLTFPNVAAVENHVTCLLAICACGARDLYEGRALLVVGTLVLQPLPVASNARDLLAVEIGNCPQMLACIPVMLLWKSRTYLGCQSSHWRGQHGSS